MMKAYFLSRSKTRSLTAQIRGAEQQILNRQRRVDGRAAKLAGNIQQQITAPATLLLAGGIGFIIGELTKRQPSRPHDTADKLHSAQVSPLRIALNLMISIHTLYTALPLAWIIKSFYQPRTSGHQAPERQPQPQPQPLPTTYGSD